MKKTFVICIVIVSLGYLSNLFSKDSCHTHVGQIFCSHGPFNKTIMYNPPKGMSLLNDSFDYSQSKKLIKTSGFNIHDAKTDNSYPLVFVSDPDSSIPFITKINAGFSTSGTGGGATHWFFNFFGYFTYIGQTDSWSQ